MKICVFFGLLMLGHLRFAAAQADPNFALPPLLLVKPIDIWGEFRSYILPRDSFRSLFSDYYDVHRLQRSVMDDPLGLAANRFVRAYVEVASAFQC